MNGKCPRDIWKCYKITLQPRDPKPHDLKRTVRAILLPVIPFSGHIITQCSSRFAYL